MKALQIARDGSYTSVEIHREFLLKEYPIYQRDLRPIILIRQAPVIIERQGILILSFGYLRCIITKEYAYIFNPRHKQVQEQFLTDIVHRLTAEDRDKRTPFEFSMIESALHTRMEALSTEYIELEKDVSQIFELLRRKLSEENFEQLLFVKNRLSRIETHVKQMEEMIDDVLEDDEKLHSFSISRKGTQSLDEEVESIFEHYYEQVDELWNSLDDLKDNIEDYENLITMKLSNVRNTIIRFDLFVSILTASFGVPAILAGIYGMNVPNGLETHPLVFPTIIVGSFLFIVSFFFICLYFMKRRNIL